MTYIMVNNYGYTLEGRKRFAINRILRIFPTYYASILISLFLLYFFDSKIAEFQPLISLPQTINQTFQNLFLLFTIDSAPRLSPPTWALTVELFFYLTICIGVSKTKKISVVWFMASAFYTIVVLVHSPENWAARYFPILSGSLPFSIGALIYHFRNSLSSFLKRLYLDNPIIWLALVLLNFIYSYKVGNNITSHWLFIIGFYTNLALMTLCIATLAVFETTLVDRKTDTKIGKYSYPIYLIHWQAGALLFSFTNGALSKLIFLMLSISVTFILSDILIRTTVNPIEKLRKRIKSTGINVRLKKLKKLV